MVYRLLNGFHPKVLLRKRFPMLREMFHAKLHRATVTRCELGYMGSITVDHDLLDAVGILVHEKVQVVNLHNGTRFETYAIPGPRGQGDVIINGAAARLAQPGDRVIILAYGLFAPEELAGLTPKVVVLDEHNRIVS